MATLLDFRIWSVCWEVSLAFSVKFKDSWAKRCIRCDSEIPQHLAGWGSEFISSAVLSECGHSRDGILCSVCEEGMAVKIVKVEQRCFVPGCSEYLSINKAELETRLSGKEELLPKYLKFGEFECVVCGDVSCCKRPVTLKCEHPINTCAESVHDMIESSLTGGAWTRLCCPEPSCREKLEFADIKFFASSEIFKRWDPLSISGQRQFGIRSLSNSYQTLLVLKSITNFPDFKWCVSGTCDWGERHPSKVDGPSGNYANFLKIRINLFVAQGADSGSVSTAEGNGTETRHAISIKLARLTAGSETKPMWPELAKGVQQLGVGVLFKKKELVMRWIAGYRSVEKPSAGDSRYRTGWDQDTGFVGTGDEWSAGDKAALSRNQAALDREAA
ncbi:MAG: hypothetical protein M1839_006690 [Geoglossum umbratile]|nr:MAG: hypothetical protein M1839_006690 [Geoglossum umbratile]